MAVHRRSRFVSHKRSSVKKWFGIDVSATTIAADASTLIASLNAGGLLDRPFTILRTRGVIHIETDQSAASESPAGVVGMIVVNDQALGAGSGSIPDPVPAADAPWIVYEPFIDAFVLGDATGFVESAGVNITFDSKAMRKVGPNEDVALMCEEAAGFGVSITMLGRMLVQLH